MLSRNHQKKRFSREWWQEPSTTAALSMGLTSFFFFGATVHLNIISIKDYLFWGKLTWWTDPISMTFMFITIYNILMEEGSKSKKARLLKNIIFIVAIIYAIVLAILGTFTNLIFSYEHTQILTINNGGSHLYVPPAKLSFLYSFQAPVLSLICFVLSLYRLIGMDQKDSKYQIYKTLFFAVGLLIIGNLIAAIGYFGILWHRAGLISTIILFISLIIFVRGVFLHNLLMEKKILKIDMIRSIINIGMISSFYLIGLTWIQHTSWGDTFDHPVIFTGLLYLTTLFHTPIRVSQVIVDGLIPSSLLPAWEKNYIEQLSDIKQDIITAMDPVTAITKADINIKEVTRKAQIGELSVMIEKEVQRIFRHRSIDDDELLSQSGLFELQILKKEMENLRKNNKVSDKNLITTQHAEVLRLFLKEQILNLSPKEQLFPGDKPSPEWIEFIILHQRYVLGKHQSEVQKFLEQIGVVATGGAYARHLQNGRKRLAAQILHRELILKQGYVEFG